MAHDSYLINPAAAVGAAGDKYTGLDRFGRVADQRWVRTAGSTTIDLDRFVYTYDRNGNPISRSLPLNKAYNESYTYDGLNQLTSFARGGGAFPIRLSWQFDAAGNWQSHGTNAQNEVVMYGDRMLRYDATGNMVVDQAGRRLVYDAWNRLVQVNTAAGAAIVRYEYDPLGQRIVQRTGVGTAAEVRDFYYSTGWQVLEERVRTPAGIIPAAANTQYVWSPVSSDALIARDRNTDGLAGTGARGLEQRIYVLQDANWNVTSLVEAAGVPTTATGAIINRFLYLPYGDEQVLSATWGKSLPNVVWQYLYQGLRVEAATGLAAARNRDYSPILGRFIERDPIGFAAGDNNLYRFVGNAPIGRTDPSGLCEIIRKPMPWPKPGSNWTPEDQAAKDRSIVAYRTDGGLLRHYGIDYSRKHGLSASLFAGPDGTFYLAFRGTEGVTNGPDVHADFMQGLGFRTEQYDDAVKLAQRVRRTLGPNVRLVLTGHSLGGGLAAAAAYATGLDAILFNPPWLNSYYSQGKPGDIRTHITCGDYLSMARTLWDIRRRPPGTIFLHPPRKTWTQLSPDTHGTDNFPELR